MRVFELLKKVGLQAILDSLGAVDFADEQVSLYCNLMLRKPVPTNGILCVLPVYLCEDNEQKKCDIVCMFYPGKRKMYGCMCIPLEELVNFLIVATCEYPADDTIETAPDVWIMTPGSHLRHIAKTPLDILAGCELCEKSIETYGETDLAACLLCEIANYSESISPTVQTDKIAARLANDKDFRDSIIDADTPADRQCDARNRAVMDEKVTRI